MPFAFGTDDHIRVAANPDRICMRLHLGDHFGIREIRKHELAALAQWLEAEVRPEINQTILRMTINAAKTLFARELNPSANCLEGEACVAIFTPHRKPLKLGKICEKPHAQAGRGFRSEVS